MSDLSGEAASCTDFTRIAMLSLRFLESLQRELGLLVHTDLVGVQQELHVEAARLGRHCKAEHHHLLLLLQSVDEDRLDVFVQQATVLLLHVRAKLLVEHVVEVRV
eukprot:13181110-Heterocapsa_arctica.AAC.1